MLVAGIDPSLNGTAVCIVDIENLNAEIHEIRFEPGGDSTKKIRELHNSLSKILNKDIDLVVIENGAYQAMSQQFTLGKAAGAIISAIPENASIVMASPKTMKKAVAGNGSASKEAVAKVVAEVLGLENCSLDASDAAGHAILALGLKDKKLIKTRAFLEAIREMKI